MCNFRVLMQNADGYVVFCHDCKTVQFAFGTSMIRMQPEAFRETIQLVRVEALCRAATAPDNIKNIFIPLHNGVTLCLTQSELAKLEQLLNDAEALFETYFILDRL